MKKIRQWMKGKKTYFDARAGLLTALASWSNETITTLQLVEMIFTAVGVACLRAGVGKKES